MTRKHKQVYRINRVDYRKMLRLDELGYSRARIAASVHNSHHTVKTVLDTAAEKGFISGTGKKLFSPNAPCTRGKIVTFLWRATESPGTAGTGNSFTDVQSGSYYERTVNWAVANKVTSGIGTATFGPDQPCTRGQIVTFLYRAES